MDGATLPLNAAILRTTSAVRDDLRVSTVTTTFLPIERSAPISVCVYTYSSSNLEEAHLQKHSTATYTYGYTTRAMNLYGGGSVYNSSTLTATNVCASEVPLRRRPSTIEALLPSRTSAQVKCTYGDDTPRLKDIDVECIYGQRPTQFRKLSTTTTTTTMTMMTSEHKDYGQSRRQSANQAPTILRHSASKNYWRRRH